MEALCLVRSSASPTPADKPPALLTWRVTALISRVLLQAFKVQEGIAAHQPLQLRGTKQLRAERSVEGKCVMMQPGHTMHGQWQACPSGSTQCLMLSHSSPNNNREVERLPTAPPPPAPAALGRHRA